MTTGSAEISISNANILLFHHNRVFWKTVFVFRAHRDACLGARFEDGRQALNTDI